MSLIRVSLNNNGFQVFLHRSEDLVSTFGPYKGFGIVIPCLSPLGNPSVEFGDTVVYAAL